MVFSSLPFLNLFLPIVLLTTILAHKIGGTRVSNPVLLVSSLVFYSWGIGATFVPILIGSIVANYLLGLWVERRNRHRLGNRLPIIASVLLNVGLLAYFKYANFFIEETASLREALGFDPLVWENVVLPIGISFFTFQSMSYVFDVAAGRARVLKNPLDFGLYVALFPQLIAGPIVRYGIVSEHLRERSITHSDLRHGALRFVHGLAKKVIIADSAGAIADTIYALPEGELTAGAAWLAAIAYTVQIYFDFSGYSDMAIGIGRMIGFKFPENFDRPYRSVSITEFWRRWHITLSNWFRDYVYIPLGGSKRSGARTYANLWAIFVLTGVWHGANWTFLIWGLYHGALLVIERLSGQRRLASDVPKMGLLEVLSRRSVVLLLVAFGWVVFRAADIGQASHMIAAMVTFQDLSIPNAVVLSINRIDLFAMFIGLLIALSLPTRLRGADFYQGRFRHIATLVALFVLLPYSLIKVMAGTYSPFLYFQF